MRLIRRDRRRSSVNTASRSWLHGALTSRKRRCGLTWPERTLSPKCRLRQRSEEHTSELQSLMRISYAVFCLKKKKKKHHDSQKTKRTKDITHDKIREKK